jgi:class 3 adenylate cyclase
LPALNVRARAALPDSAFAYVDARGRRRLPVNDAAHTRNALARFEQTVFEDDRAREQARQRLLKAARKYGISPIGFFDRQLRKERRQGEMDAKEAKMARLPAGVVTFLLADVEASTRITQELGDSWPTLLADLWRILRRAVRAARGDEVDVRGDEYFAVFRRPLDAVLASIAAQRAISKHAWPDGRRLRVRIGLHTGKPTIADASYVGLAVHTVARVCCAGHGGQILLSAASSDAIASRLVDEVRLRALGEFSLSGLPRPEPLFQVEAAGLLDRFPKLRAKRALPVTQ